MTSVDHRHYMFSVYAGTMCVALTLFAMGCSDSVECKANSDCGVGLMCVNDKCVRPVAGGTDSASGSAVDSQSSLDTAYIPEPDSATAADTETGTSIDTAAGTSTDSNVDTATDTDSSTGTSGDTATESDSASDTDSDASACYIGNYNISNEEDRADFEVFPCIVGSLSVLGTSLDILSLPNLESITGDLVINNNESLVEISMPLLTRLGRRYTTDPADPAFDGNVPVGLYIAGNPLLQNLETFASVYQIEGKVTIERNASLVSLKGLDNVLTLPRLEIKSNESLQTLDGLNSLRAIERNVMSGDVIADGLLITGNPVLQSLEAFTSLRSVEGKVQISGNGSLQNLKGLEQITELMMLHIEGNNAMTTLEGLEGLRTVATSLSIVSNPRLVGLMGLIKLTEFKEIVILDNASLLSAGGLTTPISGLVENVVVTGNAALLDLQIISGLQSTIKMSISGNNSLESVTGLERITELRSLVIVLNPALVDLTGLRNLQKMTLTDSESELGELILSDNDALTSLEGLQSLTDLQETTISKNDSLTRFFGNGHDLAAQKVTIENNAAMTNLAGLEGVTSNVKELHIVDNAALVSLEGLNSLTAIESLNINGNLNLASLSGLNALQNVDTFGLSECPAITDLLPLSSLKTASSLTFDTLESLTTLNGLQGLTEIPVLLNISNNAALANFAGLENVHSIHQFDVADNGVLETFSGCSALETVHQLTLSGNAALNSMSGLENVTEITGNFIVADNPSLPNFAGFDNLVVVGNAGDNVFRIQGNSMLTTLDGLEKMHTVSGKLEVLSNPNLVDIVALGSLLYVGQNANSQNIVIGQNSNLPTCQLCNINWGAISPAPSSGSQFQSNSADACGEASVTLSALNCDIEIDNGAD